MRINPYAMFMSIFISHSRQALVRLTPVSTCGRKGGEPGRLRTRRRVMSTAIAFASIMTLLAACNLPSNLLSNPLTQKPLVFAVTSTGTSLDNITQFIYAIDASSGKVMWRVRPTGVLTNPIAVSGDLMLVASDSAFSITTLTGGHLTAYDVQTGRIRWQKGTDDSTYAAMVTGGGVVVLASYTTSSVSIAAFRAADGVTLWQNHAVVPMLVKDLIVAEHSVIALEQIETQPVASYAIEGFRLADGHQLWKHALANWGYRLVTDNNSIYVDNTQHVSVPPTGNLVALKSVDGSERWTTSGLDGGIIYPVAAAGGILYAQTDIYDAQHRPLAGQLLALSPDDGRVQWRVPLLTLSQQPRVPLVADDGQTTFVCTRSFDYFSATDTQVSASEVLALDRSHGAVRWTKSFSQELTPPIAVAGNVAIGLGLPDGINRSGTSSDQGAIIDLNATDGTVRWRVDTYGLATWNLATYP